MYTGKCSYLIAFLTCDGFHLLKSFTVELVCLASCTNCNGSFLGLPNMQLLTEARRAMLTLK